MVLIENRGGCGIVWLGKSCKNEIVAIKQISKKNLKSDVSHFARKEIEIFNYLSHIQQNDNIIKLLDYVEDCNDFWLVFEKGGQNFGSLLFKLKGDFHNNERIYCIQKGIFLKYLFSNLKLFKEFLRKMLNFINFLTINGITHCDIKPDNILIDYKVDDVNEATITNLKMIDFGSAFYFKSPDNFNSNTPEYMSPEINEINEKGGNSLSIVQFIKELNPWCIDMWSLGVTVLEIVLACPTWMSYKTKIKRNNKVFNC
jgi:serine/threonine protein kinase